MSAQIIPFPEPALRPPCADPAACLSVAEVKVGDVLTAVCPRCGMVGVFHEGGALMPLAQFRKMGVFDIRTREVGGMILPQTYVTPRGLEFLRRRWADKVATDARVALVVRAQATLDHEEPVATAG